MGEAPFSFQVVRIQREVTIKRPKYLVGNKPFNRLPIKQRAIFILHLGGFTYEDIQALGIASNNTISKAISRGRKEYINQK